MKMPLRRPFAWTVLLVATFGVFASHAEERRPPSRAAAAEVPAGEARVIVKYRADSTLMRALSAANATPGVQHAQALSNRLGMSLTDGRTIGARAQVVKGQGMTSDQLAARLATQDDVEYAVVDGRKQALAIPNDPLYPAASTTAPVTGQWYLRPPTSSTIVDATSVVSAINAQAAWDITTGNSSVVVADLDTGIRLDHPDLAPKLRPGYDFVTDTTVSVDGDGRDADPSDPGDYGCPTGSASSSWHGTETAGLIAAATNNGAGMAGVGYNVMLLPVRVLGKCGGYDSDILAAMLWAGGVTTTPTANPYPAKVINLSLGSTGACSTAYADAVSQLNAKGVVVVAAAGNDGLSVGTPANCAGVIAVAGVRHAGTKVGYSDLGTAISIAAPAGNCVNATGACLYPLLTTSNTGTTTPVAGAAGAKYTGSGSDASLGTSFSAPLVSGTVALMFSANASLTPAQVLAAIKGTARPFPSSGAAAGVTACTVPTTGTAAQASECYCTTSTCGAGMLDTGAAVAAVAAATASIATPSSSVVAGTSITVDGSTSRGFSGSAITAYQWSVTSGPATITSATNASSAVLLPSAAGTVTVSLTVTDATGRQATTSTNLTVTAPATTAPPTGDSSGGGGGGGGAIDPAWLIASLAALAALRWVTPGRRRAPIRRAGKA